MLIVGLTGGIGHGKTTLAAALADCAGPHQHFESSYVISEVANDLRGQVLASPKADDLRAINVWLAALPDILQARTHRRPAFTAIALTEERLSARPDYYEKLFDYLQLMQQKPELVTLQITNKNKQTYRSLLQWLGGYLAKVVAGELWFEEIVRRTAAIQPLELATIGGVRFPADAAVIRKAGGKIVNIVRPDLGEADLQDITERERSLITAEITVYNDSDLAALTKLARVLYADLKAGSPKTVYKASGQA